ncbi:MAG: VWA domain-containing protein, partial [Chloroflexi bacterium]|nr:VWA domain-containing protein [Chloroflexota bacterium]
MEIGSHFRYSQWDGSQQPFDADASALMEELSDDIIKYGDVQRALRDLMRRGMQNEDGSRTPNLRDMMDRLSKRRLETLQRYDMDSMVRGLQDRLDDILSSEREGIERRLAEAREQIEGMSPEDAAQHEKLMEMLETRADRNRAKLDQMPEGLGGAIKELQEYDFMDPDAQSKFQELMDELRKQMMGNVASEMKRNIEQMTPEQMDAMRRMMRDLNEMMQDKLSGQEPDFDGFMDKWSEMFGENPPQSFDELMQMLAQQMGQMQSMMSSMSPDQRRELFDAMNAAMDDATGSEMERLAENLGQLMPMQAFQGDYPFFGDEDVSFDQAMDLMGEMQSMDDLERQLEQVMRSGDLSGVDPDELERLLGEDARRELEQLNELAKRLEDAGFLKRDGDKLELTPAGIRKIGNKALRDLFGDLRKGRGGQHDINQRGSGGENADDTKKYEFGDPMELHLQKTVMNAVERSGAGTPVKIEVGDFEVRRTEHNTQVATVLLIDQSRSMGMFGSFVSAKKVAIALDSLIRSKYPRDNFWVLGFAGMAEKIERDQLPFITYSGGSGTNMQHAFATSRQLLAPFKDCTKQILMITDGEPTAHIENGRPFFSYPPTYRTIQETLREVRRCTQEGITINTFML